VTGKESGRRRVGKGEMREEAVQQVRQEAYEGCRVR
jgi:hypothetical protein